MSWLLDDVNKVLKCGSIPDIIEWFEYYAGDRGRPCLINQSIVNKQEDVVEALIRHGALKHAYGDTPPLNTACEYSFREYSNCRIMKMLLDAGEDIEAKDSLGKAPLYFAALNGHDAAIQLLLEHGADIDVTDGKGITPLMLAVRKNHPSTVKLLVDAGADKTLREARGRTAYDMAKSFGRPDSMLALITP